MTKLYFTMQNPPAWQQSASSSPFFPYVAAFPVPANDDNTTSTAPLASSGDVTGYVRAQVGHDVCAVGDYDAHVGGVAVANDNGALSILLGSKSGTPLPAGAQIVVCLD